MNEGTRATGLQGGATPNERFDSFPSSTPQQWGVVKTGFAFAIYNYSSKLDINFLLMKPFLNFSPHLKLTAFQLHYPLLLYKCNKVSKKYYV